MLASMAEREQLRNHLVAKIVYSHETTKSFGTKLRKCADFAHLPVIPSTPFRPFVANNENEACRDASLVL